MLRAWTLLVLSGALANAGAADPGAADFVHERASREVRHVANWVVHAGDNRAGERPASARLLPFVIVDKKDAWMFVFEADGRLRGAAPALLGMGRGDSALPGIGDRELRDIAARDRTTPAGRFVASLGVDARGEEVLWVDYEGAVAIHRVITTNPAERRLHRLATATPADNRISFGCINVPVKFYESVLSPSFKGTYGIVYVLPETRTAREVFASYDVEGQNVHEKGAAAPSVVKGSAVQRKQKLAVK